MNRFIRCFQLSIAVACMTQVTGGCGPSVRDRYDHHLKAWDYHVSSKNTQVPLVRLYMSLPSYKAIVELGPDALPLIWKTIEPEINPASPPPGAENVVIHFSPRTGALLFAAAEISGLDLQEATDVVAPDRREGDTAIPTEMHELHAYLLKLLRPRLE